MRFMYQARRESKEMPLYFGHKLWLKSRTCHVNSLRIDTDLDLGVPSRVLDLLVAQGRLPERFELVRAGERYGIVMGFADLPASAADTMAARIRQMPGVLTVEQRAFA